MSFPSSRLIACVSRCQLRSRSTLSAVKAGLRAEEGQKFEARRSRDDLRDNAKGRQPFRADRSSRHDADRSSFRADDRLQKRYELRGRQQFSTDKVSRGDRDRATSRKDVLSDLSDNAEQSMSRKERRAKFWEENRPPEDDNDLDRLPSLRHAKADDPPQGSHLQQALRDSRFARDRRTGKLDRDKRANLRQKLRQHAQELDDDDGVPQIIPYTTASSQFIYGGNMVLATLLSGRRKFYNLYLSESSNSGNMQRIRGLAAVKKIKVTRMNDEALFNEMSKGRPHNGIILETSPLPAVLASRLEKLEPNGSYNVALGAIDGSESKRKRTLYPKPSLPPFVLFLDGVTDPGNFGNIVRSAHFLGVGAVAFNNRTCCDVNSPILAKASAGACEAVNMLSVSSAGDFISQSSRQGWTICAAVAPADTYSQSSTTKEPRKRRLTPLNILQRPEVTHQPCILMLGGEGEGLPSYLQKSADVLVTIVRAPLAAAFEQEKAPRGLKLDVDVGVDSMNVGSAAALLISAFQDGARMHSYVGPSPRDRKKAPKAGVANDPETVADVTKELAGASSGDTSTSLANDIETITDVTKELAEASSGETSTSLASDAKNNTDDIEKLPEASTDDASTDGATAEETTEDEQNHLKRQNALF